MVHILEAPRLSGYALLDSGAGEKLERFGEVTLRRPDPQALWRKGRAESEWDAADLTFERESDRGGSWRARKGAPRIAQGVSAEWAIEHDGARFLIRPTPFKHVGIFPEQAANWNLVRTAQRVLPTEEPRLLNLFGYTGRRECARRPLRIHGDPRRRFEDVDHMGRGQRGGERPRTFSDARRL